MRTRTPWLWLVLITVGLLTHHGGVRACIDFLHSSEHSRQAEINPHVHAHGHDAHAHSHTHDHTPASPEDSNDSPTHLADHHHHTHGHSCPQIALAVRPRIAGEFDPEVLSLVSSTHAITLVTAWDSLSNFARQYPIPTTPAGYSQSSSVQLRGIVMLT